MSHLLIGEIAPAPTVWQWARTKEQRPHLADSSVASRAALVRGGTSAAEDRAECFRREGRPEADVRRADPRCRKLARLAFHRIRIASARRRAERIGRQRRFSAPVEMPAALSSAVDKSGSPRAESPWGPWNPLSALEVLVHQAFTARCPRRA